MVLFFTDRDGNHPETVKGGHMRLFIKILGIVFMGVALIMAGALPGLSQEKTVRAKIGILVKSLRGAGRPPHDRPVDGRIGIYRLGFPRFADHTPTTEERILSYPSQTTTRLRPESFARYRA